MKRIKKPVALVWCEKPGVFAWIGLRKNGEQVQTTGFKDCYDAAKDAVEEGFEWLLLTEEEMLKIVRNW